MNTAIAKTYALCVLSVAVAVASGLVEAFDAFADRIHNARYNIKRDLYDARYGRS